MALSDILYEMTPNWFTELIVSTGRDRRWLARMLGYASKTSLTQAEIGTQVLPDAKLRWLYGYAHLRQRLAKIEADWLKKNPPPIEKNS